VARVSVVGGGVAGLAAAGRAARAGHRVELHDAGSYADRRRGAWGEVVADFARIPLDETADGVVRSLDEIAVRIPTAGRTRRVATLRAPDAVVIDRGRLERGWRRALPAGVEVFENHRVDPAEFDRLCARSELVIDASGPVPVSASVAGLAVPPAPAIETLSARATGDFAAHYPTPTAIVGPDARLFVTTKSPSRATYGVGVERGRERAPDPARALAELCAAAGVPVPDRSTLRVGLEPLVGSRPPARCRFRHDGAAVRLVGDAAGLVSGLNQFGLCRAIDSARAAVAAWGGGGSYVSWLRRRTWRLRVQARALVPLERRFGGDRVLAALGGLPGSLSLSWF